MCYVPLFFRLANSQGRYRSRWALGLAMVATIVFSAAPASSQVPYSYAQEISPPGAQNGYLGLDVTMAGDYLAMGAPWRTARSRSARVR